MSQEPYPDETPGTGWWDGVFAPRFRSIYANSGLTYPDNERAFRWASRTAYDIAAGMTKEASLEKHALECMTELGQVAPTTPGTPTVRPLRGRVRIENKMWRDDSGWRRILLCSWFTALRTYKYNRAEFERQIDVIARCGYQGFRLFTSVGGWTPYWDGYEVVPVRFQKGRFEGNHLRPAFTGQWLEAWPDYDDCLHGLLDACASRQLRVYLTTGDDQIIFPTANDKGAELELHRRVARIVQQHGGPSVAMLAECTNEFPLNRYAGESNESIAQMGRIIDVWRAECPSLLTAQGAIPQDEEPSSLERASVYGDVCVVHPTREPFEKCMKRTNGLVYYEGNYRGFDKAFKEGEPWGSGQGMYPYPCTSLDQLVALYALHGLTGQASVFHTGAGVKHERPLESELGFEQVPALLAQYLPEDVAQWSHAHNSEAQGCEYYFKGSEFRAALSPDWNPAPPRGIGSWTLVPSMRTGTGTPPSGSTGLLVGQFNV